MLDTPAITRVTPSPAATSDVSRIVSLLGIIVAVVVVACLYLARDVLIPLTLAVLLSFLLAPLARLLRRLHLGRALSAVAAAVIGLGLVLVLGWLIGTQIAGLAGNVPRYQVTVEHKLDTVRRVVVDKIAAVSNRFTPAAPAPAPTPSTHPSAAPHPAPTATAKPPTTTKPTQAPKAKGGSSQLGTAFHLARQVLLPIASPLGTAAIVFVVSIFILLQREDLRDRLIRVFGSGDLHRTTIAMDEIGERLSNYYIALLAVNASFGTAIGLGLWAIGVPSPLLWGILAMLMRFVPYVGSPLAALLPLALAIAVSPGWSMAIWTVALFVATELIVSQAIEPFLYGRTTGLSPFAVVAAAIFWTWAWGAIGLLLSTPLTVCLVVLGRYVKSLEFIEILLGNRPPLSPIENFYQRLLAGDPDEVQEDAEAALREQSLAIYYDEIAVKGLQLATADAARGVLSPEHLGRVHSAIVTLVHELEDETALPASLPAPTEEPADAGAVIAAPPDPPLVLCIAGRGPLDDGAAEMLAHLLRQAGLRVQVAPHSATARARVAALDLQDVAVVALCYLDLSATPAHLRFLLRRLRHRLPGRPIAVGLVPRDEPAADVARLLSTVGADHAAATLEDLASACGELARDPHASPRSGQSRILPAPTPASPPTAQAAE
ncbi:MAG: AI-2E family transporter [Proteobacteria bacterium]|nr:AI-2E family transporter [Pseudomonadota bacterium]